MNGDLHFEFSLADSLFQTMALGYALAEQNAVIRPVFTLKVGIRCTSGLCLLFPRTFLHYLIFGPVHL